MTDIKSIGIVIADKDEYIHIESALGGALKNCDVCGLVGHTADVETKSGTVNIITVCSGIGKVNATIAATLIADKCDIILNAGLSGGFGDAKKYDLVVGTKLYEHDFDLTAIGYQPSQKPGQAGILECDRQLVADVAAKFPFVKLGAFVTGDSFICDKVKHDELVRLFDPVACDMESAAIAAVAQRFSKPYLSIRMVSDGADDDSAATYTDTLGCDVADRWVKLTFDWIRSL